MENASSLKTKPETPKTPGGISKSLLTPCRRVGLSRNWRKSVASPFNSPLASLEAKQDNVVTRKRKETLEETPTMIGNGENPDNVGTPTRRVELPRKKKSKMLLISINKTAEDDYSQLPEKTVEKSDIESLPRDIVMKTSKAEASKVPSPVPLIDISKVSSQEDIVPDVSTPVRLKSKSISKKKKSPKSYTKAKETEKSKDDSTKSNNEMIDIEKENLESTNKLAKSTDSEINNTDEIESKNKKKENSPNNLTKECIVVIQKKIFKNQLKDKLIKNKSDNQQTSQALFNDSDSDDVPLNCVNKAKNYEVETITIDDDDEFATNKNTQKKTTSNKYLNAKPSTNTKANAKESIKTTQNIKIHNKPSQSSIDDDDEFFEKKRTIVVRKTYDKVIKPLKAKSTGSITQKDIEDLKARIETKKKMLLAKSMTDTKELRELIKKWQKGCQDALMELMDLMKTKCPEQNMEYSQILQTLKIPSNLVGYDSDNDCFVTPDDQNIILSHIKE